MTLSVVLPAYQEAHAIPTLLPRLIAALENLEISWEIVFVDDGSIDETWSVLADAAAKENRIRALRLSRNFGHQAALTAGLSVARGEAVITMDSDLQHPPEVIPFLLAKGLEGHDVVYAVRSSDDSAGWFKRKSASAFYWFFNRLTSLDLPEGAADFRFMSRRVIDAILAMPERSRFLRGMTRWVGYRQATITYDRRAREAGETKYTYRRMLVFAWDAMTAFSSFPLKIASSLGITISFVGLVYLIYVLIIRFFSNNAVPGWTSVTAAVILLSGAQLICFGIMGQYIGRIYEETKGRPLFFVADDTALSSRSEGFEAPDGAHALSGQDARTRSADP